MTKAIIKVCSREAFFDSIHERVAKLEKQERPEPADFNLSFTSARDMHTRLSPARMDLLRTLKKMGPSNVRALAAEAGRNYSNVHTDVDELLELGLMERMDDGTVCVPFESIDISVLLEHAA